jgi:VIT1/CCC1 family predicted Fe2+/Mn2+ transporter
MKKGDLTLLLLALALILAAIITLMRGGEKSRHGIGQMSTGIILAHVTPPHQNKT